MPTRGGVGRLVKRRRTPLGVGWAVVWKAWGPTRGGLIGCRPGSDPHPRWGWKATDEVRLPHEMGVGGCRRGSDPPEVGGGRLPARLGPHPKWVVVEGCRRGLDPTRGGGGSRPGGSALPRSVSPRAIIQRWIPSGRPTSSARAARLRPSAHGKRWKQCAWGFDCGGWHCWPGARASRTRRSMSACENG